MAKRISAASPEDYVVADLDPNLKICVQGCYKLEDVRHVTHVRNAINIVEEGKLHAALIYDESILNSERIQVVWLSPNYWTLGYRYGNIGFTYDWKNLVAGKNYYWVEAMGYSPHACRILVTQNNFDDNANLTSYDPTQRNGPWWFDEKNDQHYFNGDYCLEIMFDGDLALADSLKIDFVDHHKDFCCLSGSDCNFAGRSGDSVRQLFLAILISRELVLPAHLGAAHEELIEHIFGIFKHNPSQHKFSGSFDDHDLLTQLAFHSISNDDDFKGFEYGKENWQKFWSVLSLCPDFESAINAVERQIKLALGI